MAFHWRQGWHFERLPNGDVRVTERRVIQETVWFHDGTHAPRGHQSDPRLADRDAEAAITDGPYVVLQEMLIPAAEWVSILASVSASGSDGYIAAAELHQGKTG